MQFDRSKRDGFPTLLGGAGPLGKRSQQSPSDSGARTPDRPIHVLILIPTLNVGGAEMDLLRTVPRIDRARFRVTICTFLERGELSHLMQGQGIEVIGPFSSLYKFRLRLRRMAKQLLSVSWWFCGKPKIGKSWLLLHAASAVARGNNTLGDLACERGDVLYCALEDNKRRLKNRMQKLFPFDGWPERLDFKCSMPRLAEGGMNVIEDWITKATKPRLVIIDTLARVKMPTRRNQTPYEADYDAIQGLQNLAGIYGVAIVVVHHLRKAESDDPFDTVSGTLGLTGAADSIMIIRREPQGVALMVQGRDVEECNKAVSFDRETSRWRIIGDADEIHQSNERSSILATLRDADAPLSPNQIATATGAKAANIRKLVAKMVDVGSVKKSQRGRYELAEHS